MRSIVYNNINESNIYLDVKLLKFYFSSEFNKKRFLDGYKKYIKEETEKLIKKYHVNINSNLFLAVAYYKKIERRGYKVINRETQKPFVLLDRFKTVIDE